jgi:hypothetical protein
MKDWGVGLDVLPKVLVVEVFEIPSIDVDVRLSMSRTRAIIRLVGFIILLTFRARFSNSPWSICGAGGNRIANWSRNFSGDPTSLGRKVGRLAGWLAGWLAFITCPLAFCPSRRVFITVIPSIVHGLGRRRIARKLIFPIKIFLICFTLVHASCVQFSLFVLIITVAMCLRKTNA